MPLQVKTHGLGKPVTCHANFPFAVAAPTLAPNARQRGTVIKAAMYLKQAQPLAPIGGGRFRLNRSFASSFNHFCNAVRVEEFLLAYAIHADWIKGKSNNAASQRETNFDCDPLECSSLLMRAFAQCVSPKFCSTSSMAEFRSVRALIMSSSHILSFARASSISA